MQFLELGRRTRRRIRLEGWLLLAIRMLLVALITFALARPWISGGFLSQFISTQSRDVVFVIDGSYSMGWEGETNHASLRSHSMGASLSGRTESGWTRFQSLMPGINRDW